MIGTVLDKYEVLQKVGEGGMATVYRGRHTTLNREVAVKVLHPHLSSSTRNRKRFAREARAIEHLRHDNILKIFDYSGATAEECYIVTEFVGGQTLTDIMSTVGFMPSEVVSLVGIHLSDALAYAHHQGVLHRDLKPDNVMIRSDGAVKLMDFGIARFLNESQVTMTGALVGSPAFMSPEQAKEGRLDARSDLFSLGTVLFYLATGHFPFHGSNPSLMLRNIIEGNRPHVTDLQPGLSATLTDTIERLLQVDPNDRPNTATEVTEALIDSLDELGPFRSEPRWSIVSYLGNPDVYVTDIEPVLFECLMTRGKAHMATGEHLASLRMFNRLLTIDENNEEVLSLVRGLDTGPEGAPMKGIIGAITLCALLVTGGLFWYWNRETQPAPPPDESIIEPTLAAPEPTLAAPEPTPISVPSIPELPPIKPKTMVIKTPPKPPPIKNMAHPTTPKIKEPIASLPDGPTKPINTSEPSVGRLELRVNNGWGYIYIDGLPTGKTTRDPKPIELRAGGHDIEIKSPLIQTHRLTAQIYPGETQRYDKIEVEYRPVTVTFDAHFQPQCIVTLDGKAKGTLESQGYTLSVPRRLRTSSIVVLMCDETSHQKRINDSTPLDSTFTHPGNAP